MADQKITQLTALTDVVADDLLAVVDDPAGSPITKKATTLDVVKGVLGALNAKLGADVAINSGNNVWVDGPSLSLSAGTWLIIAQITLIKVATTICNMQGRLTDGTNHFASAQVISVSNNPQGSTLPLTSLVVLAGTTTVKLQGTTSTAAATVAIRAATTTNGSGNNATQITAIRVA